MLQPKHGEYHKGQEGRSTGIATRGNVASSGELGLRTMGHGRLAVHQIESVHRAITRYTKRGDRTWVRIFPDEPISRKPAEARMDNGKGSPGYYVAEVQPDKILYEIDGIDEKLTHEAFRLTAAKLPIATNFVVCQVGT